MDGAKKIAFSLIGRAPVTTLSHYIFKRYPLVVLYHGVTEYGDKADGISNYRGKHVPRTIFERDLCYLERHFTIVPLEYIERLVCAREKPHKPLCAITFDDGYKNNATVAYPILRTRGIPATLFVTTNFLDTQTPLWTDRLEFIINHTKHTVFTTNIFTRHETFSLATKKDRITTDDTIRTRLKKMGTEDRERIIDKLAHTLSVDSKKIHTAHDYAPLSWEDVKEMSKNDITFGAHTVSHPILGRLTKSEQEREITLSTHRLHSTIGSCRHFAYPNGQGEDWNEDTKEILKRAGFKAAWTTLPGRINVNNAHLFELPRITLDDLKIPGRREALMSNTLPSIKKILS